LIKPPAFNTTKDRYLHVLPLEERARPIPLGKFLGAVEYYADWSSPGSVFQSQQIYHSLTAYLARQTFVGWSKSTFLFTCPAQDKIKHHTSGTDRYVWDARVRYTEHDISSMRGLGQPYYTTVYFYPIYQVHWMSTHYGVPSENRRRPHPLDGFPGIPTYTKRGDYSVLELCAYQGTDAPEPIHCLDQIRIPNPWPNMEAQWLKKLKTGVWQRPS
jgi:hypothetical protein